MIVRKGELYDLYAVHEMVNRFGDEGIEAYGLGYDPGSLSAAIEMIVRYHLGVVAVEDDEVIGTIGGIFTPYYANNKSVFFQEILWYVRPDKRATGAAMKMFYKALELAKQYGATHIIMSHTGKVLSEKLAGLYERLGFEVLETQYIREL